MKINKITVKSVILTVIFNILFALFFTFGKEYNVKGIDVSDDGWFVIAMAGFGTSEVTLYFYNLDGIMINKVHTPYVRGAQVCLAIENNYVVIPCVRERSFIYDLNGNFVEENNQMEIQYYEFPKKDPYLIHEEHLSDSLTDLEYQHKSDMFVIQYGHNKYNNEEIWFSNDKKTVELTINKKKYLAYSIVGTVMGIIVFNGIIIFVKKLKQSDKEAVQ